MTTCRRFSCDDLFHLAATNLDPLTETYTTGFYLMYLTRWPDMCTLLAGPSGVSAYILGKAEGLGQEWRGHVSALTVAPAYRRQGQADRCMAALERASDAGYRGNFVDLFVRASNLTAIRMYSKFGYSVYRRILGYYSGEEDAFDMRKALSRDVHRRSIVPLPRPITVEEMLAARGAGGSR